MGILRRYTGFGIPDANASSDAVDGPVFTDRSAIGRIFAQHVNGLNFSGYDYGIGQHFSGTVNGGSISLYDYGESKHFSFSV